MTDVMKRLRQWLARGPMVQTENGGGRFERDTCARCNCFETLLSGQVEERRRLERENQSLRLKIIVLRRAGSARGADMKNPRWLNYPRATWRGLTVFDRAADCAVLSLKLEDGTVLRLRVSADDLTALSGPAHQPQHERIPHDDRP